MGKLPVLLLVLALPALLAVATPQGDFADRILAAHNRERSALGVPPLAWSEPLAGEARRWAAQLGRIRGLAHMADDPRAAVPRGENLWAGTRRAYSVEQMVGYWLAERAQFRAGRFPDNSRSGELADVGHYTQMVWRSTREVGCAVADNGADDYLVCRYAGGGNVIGESPL